MKYKGLHEGFYDDIVNDIVKYIKFIQENPDIGWMEVQKYLWVNIIYPIEKASYEIFLEIEEERKK